MKKLMSRKRLAQWTLVAAFVTALCGCYSVTPQTAAHRLATSYQARLDTEGLATDPCLVFELTAQADRLARTGVWVRQDFAVHAAPPFLTCSYIAASFEAFRKSGSHPRLVVWVGNHPVNQLAGGRVLVWDQADRMDDWAKLIEGLDVREEDTRGIQSWIDGEGDLNRGLMSETGEKE